MTERDGGYAKILSFGLVRMRDAGEAGYATYCVVEAEHLHNIPSLIGEANEKRHEYYFDKERTWYLERVDRTVPGVAFTLKRYEELWEELRRLRG